MLKALVIAAVLAVPATSLARDVHYPAHGSVVRELPHGYSVVGRGRTPYYYGGGSWYRPRGSRFVVVTPPSGSSCRFCHRSIRPSGTGACPTTMPMTPITSGTVPAGAIG